jgi:membrane-bound metal-dependent hydrolase YbcI (DUF457 family)
MFVGHYSASFALKAAKPAIPLWVLFLAVQAVDIGWGTLVLLGVEHANYVPGFTKAFPLDLSYMPFTHSLVSGLIWAAACAAIYFVWRGRDGIGAAMIVGLAVLSHWFLDLPVHVADLPLYDNSMKQGFGLWNYPVPELALEVGLLLGAVWLYARRVPQHARGAWIFGIVMALIQTAQTLGPWMLKSAHLVAISALVSYVGFAFVAYRIERA